MADLLVMAEVVLVQIPPAAVSMQEPWCQIPTAHLFLDFATEGAHGFGMLACFSLLHHFSKGGTVMGSLFTGDSDLIGVFSHVTAN